MAAIPVLANLPAMKTPTYQDYLVNPEAVRAQVQRAASHARSHAVYHYAIAPLVRFCGSVIAVRGIRMQLDPRSELAR